MNDKLRGFPPGVQRTITQNINVDSLPPVVCANCGWHVYIQANIIKRVSAVQSKDGKPHPLVIPVLFCTRCENMFRSDTMITADEYEKAKREAS